MMCNRQRKYENTLVRRKKYRNFKFYCSKFERRTKIGEDHELIFYFLNSWISSDSTVHHVQSSTEWKSICCFTLNNDVWDLYKKSIDCFWRAKDVDLSRDNVDWIKLTADEKRLIKMVLAFFASSDGVFIGNLVPRFMVEVRWSRLLLFSKFKVSVFCTVYWLILISKILMRKKSIECL